MGLPVTTPMLTLPDSLAWREYQLGWYAEPVVIKQDHELIEYIKHNHIQHAIIHGDDFFSQHVNKVDYGPVDLVIWIENQSFDFEQLVNNINTEITNNLSQNGTLYLAVNKFLCSKSQYTTDLPDDYNYAIFDYVTKNVNAVTEKYFPDLDGEGTMFNWVHPLTRFYFRK